MTTPSPDTAQLRRWVYWLLIVIAFSIACGRIVSVQRVYEPAFHRDKDKKDDRRPLWPEARPNPMPTFGNAAQRHNPGRADCQAPSAMVARCRMGRGRGWERV